MAIDPDVQVLLGAVDVRLDTLEAAPSPGPGSAPGLVDVGMRYVATSGNDNNDGLSWATAFALPQRAADDLALVEIGATIRVANGLYDVGAGITTTIPGLSVIGEGHSRYLTPGREATQGVIFKATSGWVWTVDNPFPTRNEYRGSRFENIYFYGDENTDGGLRCHVNNMTVKNCTFANHTTGIGFLLVATSNDDASWLYMSSCIAQDSLTGYDISGGCQLVGNNTLKTRGGGIQQTGVGFIMRKQGTILGGKAGQDGVGLRVETNTGVNVLGFRTEGCPTGVELDRSVRRPASRIKLLGLNITSRTSADIPIKVGPNQMEDIIIGCNTWPAGNNVDDGVRTEWIASGPMP